MSSGHPPRLPAALPVPSGLAAYVQALRTYSFTASVVPLLFGAALALRDPGGDTWALLPVVLLSGVLLHAGANVVNDIADFDRGVDQGYELEGSSGVLTRAVLPRSAVVRYAAGIFAVATGLGLVLVGLRGWPMLALGVAGLLGAAGYSGGPAAYKYVGLGDPLVAVLMGPLLVIAAQLAIEGRATWGAVAASVPIAALVTAVIVANNLRDVTHDRETGVRTISTAVPWPAARAEYAVLLIGAYVAVGVLVAAGTLPWPALLPLGTLPLAIGQLRALAAARPGIATDLRGLVPNTAKLHAAFGALLILGVVLGRLV